MPSRAAVDTVSRFTFRTSTEGMRGSVGDERGKLSYGNSHLLANGKNFSGPLRSRYPVDDLSSLCLCLCVFEIDGAEDGWIICNLGAGFVSSKRFADEFIALTVAFASILAALYALALLGFRDRLCDSVLLITGESGLMQVDGINKPRNRAGLRSAAGVSLPLLGQYRRRGRFIPAHDCAAGRLATTSLSWGVLLGRNIAACASAILRLVSPASLI